ncbi:MAG: triose-phosphate isomerase [Spirochaetota bacterium]
MYIIAGNWKLNKTPSEAKALAKSLLEETAGAKCEVVLAPSFVALPIVAEVIRGSHIKLAAQNVSQHLEGAYTGETSVWMLKDLGVEYVILGHSERRQYYGEDNTLINAKIQTVVGEKLRPILCIGETLEEREAGKAVAVCHTQLQECLAGISAADMANVVIAYEPIWAIGTGKTASPEDANEIHMACREKLASLYSKEVAEKIVIQYGGSVKPDNVQALMAMSDIDGALVGGASLKSDSFAALTRF